MKGFLFLLGTLAPLLASAAISRTSEANEATILDAASECTSYSYGPVSAIVSGYPTVWETASLQFAGVDKDDAAVFASMNASIPNIAPRGTREGNFSAVTYSSEDPDCWWSWAECTTPKLEGLQSDITKCDEPETWGFTLDDGPNCSHNAYFDYLQTINQKATLFYIGSNVIDWPLEGQRGLADGHEICAHTWSHPYMTSMTNEQAFAELYFAKKAIKDVLGVTVRCWRPPYGDVDDRIRFIAQQLDLRTVVWSEDTDDWEVSIKGAAVVRANYENILAKQANGSYATYGPIVLTHEINNQSMALSQEFLPSMRKAFTGGVVPIGVCMNNTNPYVETANYTYPNYAQYVAGTVSVSLAAPTAVSQSSRLQISNSTLPYPTAAVSASSAANSKASVAASSTAQASSAAQAGLAAGASASAHATAHAGGAERTQANFAALGVVAGAALGAVAVWL